MILLGVAPMDAGLQISLVRYMFVRIWEYQSIAFNVLVCTDRGSDREIDTGFHGRKRYTGRGKSQLVLSEMRCSSRIMGRLVCSLIPVYTQYDQMVPSRPFPSGQVGQILPSQGVSKSGEGHGGRGCYQAGSHLVNWSAPWKLCGLDGGGAPGAVSGQFLTYSYM